MAMLKNIEVRGAREHNLKGVDVDLPRDKLIVITGLSGSGKSSLAFDTIYAEGQRRYVESLSAYARQFLELQSKPDVDSIEGLSPAISIEQKTTSKNPRSTVGTVTEIYDYMRLLWARVGIPYSPATGLPIESQTVSQMVDRTMTLPEGTKLYILAPVVRNRKGEFKKDLAEYMRLGFLRAKINGELVRIEDAPDLDKKFKHDIDVVVDRVVVREGLETRLADSIEQALRLADGLAVAEDATTGERILFSEKFACPVSGFTLAEIEPRLFSFNPWSKTPTSLYMQTLKALSKHYKFSVDKPWAKLSDDAKYVVLYGTGREQVKFEYKDGKRSYKTEKTFEGVIPNLDRRYRETDSTWMREELSKYMSDAKCDTCDGKRLRAEALSVRVSDMDISIPGELSIKDAYERFDRLRTTLSAKDMEIAERILKEILDRLKFLNAVGLDYLTLGRGSGSLSGGESQRIRLASQIGSGLTGVLYVLDEPSIGLHQRDNERLLETLQNLRDLGNTVIVVEHDEDAILTADYVVDMGPKAGVHGGQVIAAGTPSKIKKSKKSITGQYLTGKKEISLPAKRRKIDPKRIISIRGARGNNLKDVDVDIPLGLMTCVTGVSGGGKSSLVMETLYKQAARTLNKSSVQPISHPFAIGSPDCQKPKHADINRGVSHSTSKAGAAKPAKAAV